MLPGAQRVFFLLPFARRHVMASWAGGGGGAAAPTKTYKVLCISLLRWNVDTEEPVLLDAAYNLAEYSFFTRGGVQEFMAFACRTVMKRLTAGTNAIDYEGNHLYCVVQADGLGAIVMTDKSYPGRVAVKLARDLLEAFKAAHGCVVAPAGSACGTRSGRTTHGRPPRAGAREGGKSRARARPSSPASLSALTSTPTPLLPRALSTTAPRQRRLARVQGGNDAEAAPRGAGADRVPGPHAGGQAAQGGPAAQPDQGHSTADH